MDKVRLEALKRPDRTMARGWCPIGRNNRTHENLEECKGVVLQADVVDPCKNLQGAEQDEAVAAAVAAMSKHTLKEQRANAPRQATKDAGPAPKKQQPPARPKAKQAEKVAAVGAPKKKSISAINPLDSEHFQLCKWFERGLPCGKACPFAHGQEELSQRFEIARRPKDSVNDILPHRGPPSTVRQGTYASKPTRPPPPPKAPLRATAWGAASKPVNNPWQVLGHKDGSVHSSTAASEDEAEAEATLRAQPVDGTPPNSAFPLDSTLSWTPPLPHALAPVATSGQLSPEAVAAITRWKAEQDRSKVQYRVKVLEQMGFNKPRAELALLAADGNVDAAVSLLLSTAEFEAPRVNISSEVDMMMAACLAHGRDIASASAIIVSKGGDVIAAMQDLVGYLGMATDAPQDRAIPPRPIAVPTTLPVLPHLVANPIPDKPAVVVPHIVADNGIKVDAKGHIGLTTLKQYPMAQDHVAELHMPANVALATAPVEEFDNLLDTLMG